MIRTIKLILLLTGLTISINSWADNDKIGSLRKVSGDGFIQRVDKTEHLEVKEGMAVYQNDLITTSEDGSLGIVFKDRSRLSLGPNSKLTVNKYVFNPSQKKYSMLTKMLKGSAKYTSGKLSKLSPGSVSFQTPDATISSRGTSFLIIVEED